MKMWWPKILLFILYSSLCCVTGAAEIISVFGYEGKEALVSCSYDEGYESYEKYLCRNDCGSDDVLIKTTQGSKNRYSISDDTNKQVFTATISNLNKNDAGKYWCGVTRSGYDYYPAEVKLKVVTDTCCDSSTKVQSYEGGSVSISCPYESQDQNNMKYICRGNQPSSCLQQALITSNNRRNTQFSLTDDKVSRKFTVTITSLTQKDSGSYLCGVQRNTGLDVFSAVDLEVRENTCCDSSTKVQSYEGGSVSISCPYESQDQNNMKYICRGNQPSSCLQQALITSNNRQNTQFSLTDHKESRKFTVTITSLTQKDSGSYLCGVKRNTGLDVFSAVDLEVREWCCVKSNKLSGTVGRPLTMQCPYPPQHGTNRKFLCKGDHHRNCTDMVTSQNSSGQTDVRFTLLDDVSSSSFSVTITELKAGDAGTYWCGSDSQWTFGNYTKIQLSLEWCCVKSNKLSGTVGRPLTMQCPYPPQHGTNRKFLCKGDHHRNCTDMVTSQNSSGHTDVRFTLLDDVSSSSFSVTITELKAGDAGTYWCGSDSQWTFGNYTKIQLSLGKRATQLQCS
ncbi:polymeric immunoglobulin receptor-like [Anabas testudineus]|uniref:polymeric immunoglobulin receptor-like n=1 Tax=Anabas testudineus TaxID=64144 RepID=UPI000E4605FF|nr:polymeric immunoglobulin receptor-like [Anabas testudineus]